METLLTTAPIALEALEQLGESFRKRSAECDRDGHFVYENYLDLKALNLFAGLVPKELGGAGMSHADMGNVIRNIARYCPSTALAFSMHQHLVSAAVWKFKHRSQSEKVLRRVAENQIVLVSTGAKDWLGSTGEAIKVKGGYRVTAKKVFASQSVAGDIAVTSAPYLNENKEWKVLHFPVPLNAEGVSLINDWDTLGMRGTGSQCIVLDNVFVPDSNIDLERNRYEFHPVWNLVLTVAMPLIMSVYVGIAERAAEIAIEKAKGRGKESGELRYGIGQMYNHLVAAQSQGRAMYGYANNFEFPLDRDNSIDILSLKTNVAEACRQTVAVAMECVGGQSFYKRSELERLFRDVQAAPFHPLPRWEQLAFTGGRIIG